MFGKIINENLYFWSMILNEKILISSSASQYYNLEVSSYLMPVLFTSDTSNAHYVMESTQEFLRSPLVVSEITIDLST